MTTPSDALYEAFCEEPWAILESRLPLLLSAAMRGLSPDVVAAIPGERRRSGAVAVLPIHGPVSPRANFFTMFFGGVGLDTWAGEFRAMLADPQVRAIVLDIDSPGGSAAGVEEMATEILASRGSKPIIAVADTLAASAAYWLASAADEIVTSPSAEVGSIGVFALHLDMSRAMDAAGVTPTIIKAGKFKAEGNPWQPLTAEAQEYLQSRVNDYYTAFVGGVAKGRGVPPAKVREEFGQGRMVGAKDAVRLGMADRVGTLTQTLARLGVPAISAPMVAVVEPVPVGMGERERLTLRYS